MSESTPSPEELARHAQQHLQSLKAAGVEWLPLGQLEAPAPAAPEPEPISLPLVSNPPSLFEEAAAAGPGSAADLTPEQRLRALELLAEQVSTCSRCPELLSTRTQTVFGQGPLDPELCFIGEAPGADEDAQGLPFVGAAGQLLNRIIAACGMKREDVFVCNILRCRPPGNRTPLVTEAANCRDYLDRTLELVRPKFLCALGGCAAQNLLGTTTSLGKLRKRFHDYKGIPVLCTYHPAYLLPHRSPDPQILQQRKMEVWEDMKMLLARMGRQVPASKGTR